MLGCAALAASGWGLLIFSSGVDELDGVVYWDSDCIEGTIGRGVVQMVGGVVGPIALWVALVAWLRRSAWWSRALAVAVVTFAGFYVAAGIFGGEDEYLPYERCLEELKR